MKTAVDPGAGLGNFKPRCNRIKEVFQKSWSLNGWWFGELYRTAKPCGPFWLECSRGRQRYFHLLSSLRQVEGCSADEESTCNAGDLGLISGLGKSPWEGNSNLLQYSGLENSMDCIVHGVSESDTTEWLSLHKASREMLQDQGFTPDSSKPPERTRHTQELSDSYPLPPASPSFPWNNWRQTRQYKVITCSMAKWQSQKQRWENHQDCTHVTNSITKIH